MVCVKKKVLNPARFFSLNDDGNNQLVMKGLLPMRVSNPTHIRYSIA